MLGKSIETKEFLVFSDFSFDVLLINFIGNWSFLSSFDLIFVKLPFFVNGVRKAEAFIMEEVICKVFGGINGTILKSFSLLGSLLFRFSKEFLNKMVFNFMIS